MVTFTAGALWWCHLLPLPQGGYWGLKSPTGHPWHPCVPLPSIPRWGNRQWGCGGGCWCYQTQLSALTPCRPRPLRSLFFLLWQISPLPTHSECSMVPTHCALHHSADSKGTNQPPQSWSRLLISTVWTGRFVSDFYLYTESSDRNTNICLKFNLHNEAAAWLLTVVAVLLEA